MYFEYINKEIAELLEKLPTLPMPTGLSGHEFCNTLIELITRMEHKQSWLEKELDKLNEQ